MPTRLMYPANGRWSGYTEPGELVLPPRVGVTSSFLLGLTPVPGGRHPTQIAGATITKMNARSRFQTMIALTDVRIALGNYYAFEDFPPASSVTFTATIEKYGAFTSGGNLSTSGSDPNETFYRVTWGGATSTAVSPRDKVLSDPTALAIPAGGYIYVRVYCTIPNGAGEVGFPLTKLLYTGLSEGVELAGSTVDKTAGGQLAAGGGFAGPAPMAVVGTPASGVTETRRVAVVGDSIAFGSHDTFNIGFIDQALTSAGIPHYNVAVGGGTAAPILDATYGLNRREMIADSTSVVSDMGINDISSPTAPQLLAKQQTYLQYWQMLATTGRATGTRPVWQTTITPHMTSVAAGATPTAGARIQWNDWLRAGAPVDVGGVPTTPGSGTAFQYLTGVFDAADAVEADVAGTLTRNGTYFKNWTTTTTDGLHPSGTGHVILAGSINTAVLT